MKNICIALFLFQVSFAFSQQWNNLNDLENNKPQLQKNLFQPEIKQNNGFKLKSFIIPTTFITYGLVALNNQGLHRLDLSTSKELWEDHQGFKTSLDNYIQYAPALAVYGLNAANIKGKNNFTDRTLIYVLTNVFTTGAVFLLKTATHIARPDSSAFNSFPSGHTTTGFVAAEFLHQEYKDVSPWYGVAGYTTATATGILRMLNNKHYLKDIIMGAGLGILSTKIMYLVYPAIKKAFFKGKVTPDVVVL
jgi:hypothetical protein